jgi:hypothetical protein
MKSVAREDAKARSKISAKHFLEKPYLATDKGGSKRIKTGKIMPSAFIRSYLWQKRASWFEFLRVLRGFA